MCTAAWGGWAGPGGRRRGRGCTATGSPSFAAEVQEDQGLFIFFFFVTLTVTTKYCTLYSCLKGTVSRDFFKIKKLYLGPL